MLLNYSTESLERQNASSHKTTMSDVEQIFHCFSVWYFGQ